MRLFQPNGEILVFRGALIFFSSIDIGIFVNNCYTSDNKLNLFLFLFVGGEG